MLQKHIDRFKELEALKYGWDSSGRASAPSFAKIKEAELIVERLENKHPYIQLDIEPDAMDGVCLGLDLGLGILYLYIANYTTPGTLTFTFRRNVDILADNKVDMGSGSIKLGMFLIRGTSLRDTKVITEILMDCLDQ